MKSLSRTISRFDGLGTLERSPTNWLHANLHPHACHIGRPFILLQIPTMLATNYGMLMVFCFLTGFFSSPFLATGCATIADLYVGDRTEHDDHNCTGHHSRSIKNIATHVLGPSVFFPRLIAPQCAVCFPLHSQTMRPGFY